MLESENAGVKFGKQPEVEVVHDNEDIFELDDVYHDVDEMISVSVLEHEEFYTKQLVARYKDSESEREFWSDKLETLTSAKENLQGQFVSGMLTEEKYL